MRIRASKSTAPKTPAESEVSHPPLEASVTTPPRLFILPRDISPEARIVTLPNPATAAPNRYYFCPEKGVYELTKVAAPKSTPRSWLLTPNRCVKSDANILEANSGEEEVAAASNAIDEQAQAELSLSNGYITEDADQLISTLIDPLFLVLPALTPATSKEAQKQLFLSLDDHLDSLTEASRGLRHVLRDAKLRERMEQRIGVVCDTVDAGDETMYRLSLKKLSTELLMKAERMIVKGLPPSMEDRFVRRVLDVPVMNVKRGESTLSNGNIAEAVAETSTEDEGSQTPSASSAMNSRVLTDSGNTDSTAATPFTSESYIASKVELPPINAPEGIPHLLRLRTAVGFLASSYIPTTLRLLVHDFTASSASPVDFAPLDTHLSYLASLRSQAAVLRSLSDNISRKRIAVEDDEAAEARAEKKRKKEEEEKRKKAESLGIKKLRKVDTSGMKKMSAFFTKAPFNKQ